MIEVFAEVRADLVSISVGTADEHREANLVPGRGGTRGGQGDFPIELFVPLHTVGMKE
jgi:hypothetical protein